MSVWITTDLVLACIDEEREKLLLDSSIYQQSRDSFIKKTFMNKSYWCCHSVAPVRQLNRKPLCVYVCVF